MGKAICGLLVVAALVFFVVGCGGESEPTPSPQKPSTVEEDQGTGEQAPTAGEAPAPKEERLAPPEKEGPGEQQESSAAKEQPPGKDEHPEPADKEGPRPG